MRFHDDSTVGRIARLGIAIAACATLAACGGEGARPVTSTASLMPANGPQADYPLVIGAPYTVDGTSYTPADVLNYDEVGYVAAGSGLGATAAHHTLPYPSYVEVTSLETGRTILARVEQRGPMDSTHLIALSPDAMAQLGASVDSPVRVRRVNAPEEHRALLRADAEAPLRMDTPMSLVEVLRRRLPAEGSASLSAPAPTPPAPMVEAVAETETTVSAAPAVETFEPTPSAATQLPSPRPALDPPESFAEAFATEPETEAPQTEPAVEVIEEQVEELATEPVAEPEVLTEGFVVQAAAFSSEDNANRAAAVLGGQVVQGGRFFRVRTGPFATRAQAEASLANVRAAGYSDARIQTTE